MSRVLSTALRKIQLREIYNWLRNPGDSLSQRVVHGSIWMFALRIANKLIGLSRSVVLARVLAPEDFGLVGIAMLTVSVMQIFSESGFRTALIQKQDVDDDYLSAGWTFLVLRGLLLSVLLFVLAPFVITFFEETRALWLTRVIGLSLFLDGFSNIGIIAFKKDLAFHKEFLYQFGGTVSAVLVAIPIAILFRSVWALVLGNLASSLVRCVLSYVMIPYRPKINLDLEKWRELFKFGRWMLGISILYFLSLEGDDVFVGKFLGASTLGLYQLAFHYANVMATEVEKAVGGVTFSAYSKLQDNLSRLRDVFFGALEATSLVTFPVTALILTLGADFVHIFLGAKWIPMVPAMRILAVAGLLRATVCSRVFVAIGRPDLSFLEKGVRVVVIAISIYPLAMRWDLSGVAAAVVLGRSVGLLIWGYLSGRYLEFSYKKLLLKFFPSLVSAVCVGVASLVVLRLLDGTGFIGFVVNIAVSGTVYAAVSLFLWQCCGVGIIRVVSELNGAFAEV